MTFTATLADRISFGNQKLRIYDMTGILAAGSTLNTGLSTVWAVKANNNTDATDTLIEQPGDGTNARDSQTARSKVIFTAGTNIIQKFLNQRVVFKEMALKTLEESQNW